MCILFLVDFLSKIFIIYRTSMNDHDMVLSSATEAAEAVAAEINAALVGVLGDEICLPDPSAAHFASKMQHIG